MTTEAAAGAAEAGANGVDAAAAAERQDLEARARRQGWKSKDEYRGPAEKWTDAQEFLDMIDSQATFKNDRIRYLDDKLSKALKQSERLERTVQEQGNFIKTHVTEIVNRGRRAEAGAYERQRASLKAQLRASRNDDVEYDRLEKALEELERNPPQIGTEDDPIAARETPTKVVPKEPTQEDVESQISYATRAWIDRNAWFKTEPEMASKAIALHGVNVTAGMSEEDSLNQVTRDIRTLFAHKFTNERREIPSSGERPAPPRDTKPRGKTIADLPDEAKVALAGLKRMIPGYTDEEYLKEYKW